MYEYTKGDLSRFSIDWCIATHNELKPYEGAYKRLNGVYGPISVTRTALRAEITRRSPECLEVLK